MDVTLAGGAITYQPDDDELSRVSIELAAFDGEVGHGQLPIPLMTGGSDVAGGRQARIDEGSTLLSDGFTLDLDRVRGPVPAGLARENTYGIMDANALLDGFIVNRYWAGGTDVELVLEFAAGDFGMAFDTTWVVNANTVTIPKKTYKSDGGWTSELIPDVVEATGKTLFVHDKADGSGRCLHYHTLNSGHTCGLVISDVIAAQDATTFFPWHPQRTRTSVDLRNYVEGRDQAGRVSVDSDGASITAHDADGLYHQALLSLEAVSQADLDLKTSAFLASYKAELDTWTCQIGPLDETALALIRVGDLITTTSTVMGLTASPQRIAHMTLTPLVGENGRSSPGWWMAALELGAPIRRRARVRNKAKTDRVNHAPIPDPPEGCFTVVDVELGAWDELSEPYEDPDPTNIAAVGRQVVVTMTPNPDPMSAGEHPASTNLKGGTGIAFVPFDVLNLAAGIVRVTALLFVPNYGGNDDATMQVYANASLTLTAGASDASEFDGTTAKLGAGVNVVPDPIDSFAWPRTAAVPYMYYVPETSALAPSYGAFYRLKLEMGNAPVVIGRRLKIWPNSAPEPDDWYVYDTASGLYVDGLAFVGQVQLIQSGTAVYGGFPEREAFFQLESYTASVSEIRVQYIVPAPCPPALHALPYGPVFVETADGTTGTFELPDYPPDPIGSVRGLINGLYEPSVYDPATRMFTFTDASPEEGDVIDAEIVPL